MTLDNNLLKKIENFKRHVLKSIPLPSTNTPSTDNTNGSTGSSLEYARSDHQHPKSTLYAESVHSHNDILSDLMDDINNTTVVVDSPNPIGQDGDTILLRGRMYGDDVSGKSIDYYIGNTLIGSSVTNGNGVSFLDYECDGLGVRNVTAKNGSIVSETYSIIDGTFKDTATLHNTKWWATGTLAIDVQTDGILVTNENASSYILDHSYLTDNFPSSWSDREQAVTCHTVPFAVEFDLVSASDLSATGLYIGTPSANMHTYFSNLNITTGKVKLEITGSQVKIKVNGEDKTPYTLNVTGDVRFGFRINGGASFKYDNLIIYPI